MCMQLALIQQVLYMQLLLHNSGGFGPIQAGIVARSETKKSKIWQHFLLVRGQY